MSIKSKVVMDIMNYSKWAKDYKLVGENAFLRLENGNNIKISVHASSIVCYTISRTGGEVDRTELPYSEYFTMKRCSPGAPAWHQCIDGNDWRYAKTDKHCLPTQDDFCSIANGIDDYVGLFM